MTSPFDLSDGLIAVSARIHGPAGWTDLRLALDTGATVSVISREWLSLIGYEVEQAATLSILTGSGRETALQITLDRIESLDMGKIAFPVLAYTLPTDTTVDGVLGIDFFEDCRLTIDFRDNTIEVE
jgi:predicted aspartyl protease